MTKDLILMLCESGKNELERTFAAVPDDKLSFEPAPGARTALDAFGQAAQGLTFAVTMIGMRGQDMAQMDIRAMMGQMAQERATWTRQDALTHMELNYSKFKAAIEALSDEELAAPLTMPMGGGTTAPVAFWIMTTYRNLVARFAQINYIQTLYGDMAPH